LADGTVGFLREKCYLALVIFSVIKETVASQSMTGNTFYGRHLDHFMCTSQLAVMAKEIMGDR
jgi:hypothetical protein